MIFVVSFFGVHQNLKKIGVCQIFQEIDLATGTLSSIQSGSRKLLGKSNPIHALKVHDGLIYRQFFCRRDCIKGIKLHHENVKSN